jgi:hypothetical protein
MVMTALVLVMLPSKWCCGVSAVSLIYCVGHIPDIVLGGIIHDWLYILFIIQLISSSLPWNFAWSILEHRLVHSVFISF